MYWIQHKISIKKKQVHFILHSVCTIFAGNMREFIIADNQDITKAGMMFLLSKQKETALLLEADNKGELIQQLRLHPQTVVILDYTLFDFSGADELIVLHERFKEVDWLLFSDELRVRFCASSGQQHVFRGGTERQFQRGDTIRTTVCRKKREVHLQPCKQPVTVRQLFSRSTPHTERLPTDSGRT